MGVSLPAKLEQKYNWEDGFEALLKASVKGISTRRTRTGGLGLWHCLEYMKEYDGIIILVARHAMVRRYLKHKTIKKLKVEPALSGTWVALSLEGKLK